jgi:hypothetical protein
MENRLFDMTIARIEIECIRGKNRVDLKCPVFIVSVAVTNCVLAQFLSRLTNCLTNLGREYAKKPGVAYFQSRQQVGQIRL